MKTFIITFRKRYWIEPMTHEVSAYSFGDAETKFKDSEEEDDLIILSIALK